MSIKGYGSILTIHERLNGKGIFRKTLRESRPPRLTDYPRGPRRLFAVANPSRDEREIQPEVRPLRVVLWNIVQMLRSEPLFKIDMPIVLNEARP